MIKNIKNECYKIYKSNRFFIFTIIIILVSIVMGGIVHLIEIQERLPEETIRLIVGGVFPLQVLSIISDMVLPLFATLLVCFLVIDEYNNGTLKLPLLCGYNRTLILVSKVIAVFVIMLAIMLLSFISAYISGIVFWGWEALKETMFETFFIYMETYISMISWTMMMFVLALFIQNSGTMIGIVSVILVMSSIVSSLFPKVSKIMVPYYFKAFESMTDINSILFGIGICFETMIIFGMFAFSRFHRMEINK